jgi:ribosomal protein S18 acetylase RimI-like enzyme
MKSQRPIIPYYWHTNPTGVKNGRRRGWIEYSGVQPQNQWQGLGRAALLAGLRQLQAVGAETALLGTYTANKTAVNLYETMGFTRLAIPETPAYQKIYSPHA